MNLKRSLADPTPVARIDYLLNQILGEVRIEMADETGDRTGLEHLQGERMRESNVLVRARVHIQTLNERSS